MSEGTVVAIISGIVTIAATVITIIATSRSLGRGQQELGRRLDEGLRAVRAEADRAHVAIGDNIHRRTRRRRIQRIVRDTDRRQPGTTAPP